MRILPSVLAAATLAFALPVRAEAPKIVADIAPIHSLVAQVVEGTDAEVSLAFPADVSPHHASLRPSQGRALSEADLVVWVGPGLSPAFARAVDSLAASAPQLVLSDVPGALILAMRGDHDHDEEQGDHHPEDHGDHDHDHAGHGHDNHDDADHEDEAAGVVDPHQWLDPQNAIVWVDAIASRLSAIDPDNAGAYRANAETASAELASLESELAELLAPLKDNPIVPFHDATQYLEARFDLEVTDALQDGAAGNTGPARLGEIRAEIEERHASCLVVEPQHDSALAERLAAETGLPIARIDVLGVGIDPGPDQYAAMMRALATQLSVCK